MKSKANGAGSRKARRAAEDDHQNRINVRYDGADCHRDRLAGRLDRPSSDRFGGAVMARICVRYVCGTFRTRDAAECELENMWASGEGSHTEHPEIERRHGRYVITLLECCEL